MRIEELRPGQELTLFVSVKDNSLVFTSKVQEINRKRHMIFADAVFQNGKPISFRGKGVILNVLASVPDDKPHLFKNVANTLLRRSDGTLCYSLTTIAESVAYNRRQNFRCYIGVETSIQFGSNHAAYEAIIRDVSSNGFSVVCDSNIKFMEGSLVHVVLKDQIQEFGEKYMFHLYGLIARIQELENGNTIYGCRLNNHVAGLDSYLMKKERYRLKKTSYGSFRRE
ncbi:MAG: hypothetical protein HFH05_00955 [Lachnospiraceae bacterium]|jgi:c-di-GMP-binding flagellar brake protein YcgR|nr:hypothetical protein [Lachnospiraceae bacterium]MCI9674642.1 hypothetical protein [Lachnospiraceae bacterium]